MYIDISNVGYNYFGMKIKFQMLFVLILFKCGEKMVVLDIYYWIK